ncbi:MAG: hypothetical protein M3Y21_08725 [Candidatus Eremiobacteraeota bacterium]|nr:hypothetical protein [Candidatus Eremiobacteraeota bacterium]
MDTAQDMAPNALRSMLAGIWDCYSPGIAAELVLNPNGSYVDTWYAAGARHWGTWDILNNAGATKIRLTLAGAFPQASQGRSGRAPIPWPDHEDFTINAVTTTQITLADGSIMVRRAIQSPAGAPQMAASQMPNPLQMPGAQPIMAASPPTNTAFQAQLQAVNDANAAAFQTIENENAHTQQMYDNVNNQFLDYLKS